MNLEKLYKSKILVIIPAYNEKDSIERVFENVRRELTDADIVVVNDCSTDETEKILINKDIPHISLAINMGIGGAMQTGYIYAREQGYDYAVQIDGDGQHDPKELRKLLSAEDKSGADMVIGSRFIGKVDRSSTTLMRRFGNIVFSLVTKVLTGQKIEDSTSGFRLVNKKVITLFAEYYPSDYPEPEVIIYLKNRGMKIFETPVTMGKRETGISSITPVRSVYYMIKVVISMILQKMKG